MFLSFVVTTNQKHYVTNTLHVNARSWHGSCSLKTIKALKTISLLGY
jgi:hypothetical protein